MAASDATAGVFWRSRTNASRPADSPHQRVTFAGDVVSSALSPDGHTVAYATQASGGGTQVLVRDMGGDRASVAWTGEQILSLSWTRDGSRLVVVGNRGSRGVWIVPLSGGTERHVSDSGKFAAASPDGTRSPHVGARSRSSRRPLSGAPTNCEHDCIQCVLARMQPRTNRMSHDRYEAEWLATLAIVRMRAPSRLLTGSDYFRAICTHRVDVVMRSSESRKHGAVRVPMYADPWVQSAAERLPIGTMDTAHLWQNGRAAVRTCDRRKGWANLAPSTRFLRRDVAPVFSGSRTVSRCIGLRRQRTEPFRSGQDPDDRGGQ